MFLRKLAVSIFRFYKATILKDKFYIEARRWFKDKGDDKLRYTYDFLNSSSLVFDIGGYEGDFAFKINEKYGCQVYIFEPHPKYFKKCQERFYNHPKIKVYNYGLGAENGIFLLSNDSDGSSFFKKNESSLNCEIKKFSEVIELLKIKELHLTKINIEGGEYDLLEHIISNNLIVLSRFYQIQFHNFINNSYLRRKNIIDSFVKTHYLNWCYDFIWESWERKK